MTTKYESPWELPLVTGKEVERKATYLFKAFKHQQFCSLSTELTDFGRVTIDGLVEILNRIMGSSCSLCPICTLLNTAIIQ